MANRVRCAWATSIALVGACGSVATKFDAPPPPIDAPAGAPDARPMCSPTGTFDPPVALPGFATTDYESSARLSPDELTLYVSRAPSAGTYDLYMAQRSRTSDVFGAQTSLTNANSGANDYDPTVSSDGLTLVFGSNRVPNDNSDLFVSTRSSTLGGFGAASALDGVNSATASDDDTQPFLTADGQELWFISDRTGSTGGHDIWRATWNGSSFGNPVIVPELSSTSDEFEPVLSADGLTVYFASNRPATGAAGSYDVWTSHRASKTDGFPAPTLVTELNMKGIDAPSWLSPDNCRLYMWTDRGNGTYDIYVATRHP